MFSVLMEKLSVIVQRMLSDLMLYITKIVLQTGQMEISIKQENLLTFIVQK
jgi:hypothetical protein